MKPSICPKAIRWGLTLPLAGVVIACSSGSSGSPSGSPDSGNEGDGGGSSSGGSSGGASSSGGATDGGGDGGTTTSGEAGADGSCTFVLPSGAQQPGGTITVHNFDSWCTVSLNGAATSVSASYQVCVPLGFSVSIAVGPASTMFELGPTPFVRISGAEVPDGSPDFIMGDGGFGSTRTVTVGVRSAAGCVLVCCPFTDGTGCDSSFSGYTTFLSDCPP